MAIIRKSYNQLIQDLGATHRFPLTGPDTSTLDDDVLGGPGTDLFVEGSTSTHISFQDAGLFSQYTFKHVEITNNSYELQVRGVPSHVSNQGLSDWSLIFFKSGSYKGLYVTIGGTEYRATQSANYDVTVMCALVHDSGAGEYRLYSEGELKNTIAGTNSDLSDPVKMWDGAGALGGEVAFFNTILSLDDIKTIDTQRRFLGKISGTVTVDGTGSPSTVRAFTRVDGDPSGEVTAASDGSYELWVTDPAELDVLATPPAGVAARPLAHGPIVPIDQN